MPYVVCKHPVIRMDIMVLQSFTPQIIGAVMNTGCTYEKEDWVEQPNGQNYLVLRDVTADKGYKLGELIGRLYAMDDTPGEESKALRKFYILLKPRKKAKKNVQKDRQEAGAGSESGAGRESTGDIQPGQDPGDRDGGNWFGGDGSNGFGHLSVVKGDDYYN